MLEYHLAQVNIARLIAPLDAPETKEFKDALAEINMLAEHSAGYVWRYIDASGNATDTRAYDDPNIIFNMSVWESIDALKDYAYKSRHVDFFRRRAAWFEKFPSAHTAMWWIPSGHTPSIQDAKDALTRIDTHGATAGAFSFAKPFPPPSQRLNITSGAVWEDTVGYCRAVRIGNIVEVAGTTAIDEKSQVVGADDAYAQTRYILQKIERALVQAGASMRHVVRTRMFVTDISHWEQVGRAHGEFFSTIKPAATMVEVSKLIDPALLVEIEASAVIH
jgi:enamine deaminase RidA (YjgF/YER057c/UK114 family)